MIRWPVPVSVLLAALWLPPASARTLEPATLPGMCVTIDPVEGSVSRPCDGSAAQRLALPETGPGPMRLGDACLAPRGGGNYPPLVPLRCDGSPGQSWTISADHVVRNGEGRCLALLALSARDGARVYAAPCPARYPPQAWRIRAFDSLGYAPTRGRLRWAPRPDLCLSLVRPGTFIGLEPCAEVHRWEQVFSFDRRGPGQFRMSGTCLSGNAGSGGLALRRCRVNPEMHWLLEEGGALSNGASHCIEPRLTNGRWVAALTLCAAIREQRWTFEEMAPP
ncbi:MAG: RICIN domain-containing protein [Sphingomonas sp.]|nr:RICIN domain-containing protein [Sphingomonas sp.]